MAPEDGLTQWQYYANEAKAGRLRFDPDVARDFNDACDKLIARFEDAHITIQRAGYIDGLGDFECAKQLTPMLRNLATGSGNSMKDALDDYIAVAKLMQETVSYSLRRTVNQDADNAGQIGSIGT